MSSPLLKTKMHIPTARQNFVARPRLIAKLNEGLTRPLTLISAPPGFGKTTLVTAWLEQQPQPAAWLSLDESDNDLARFLTYLVTALETVHADVGRRALNRLHSRRARQMESVMTLLTNDIAAIHRPFILVLDDYHLIQVQSIHAAMTFLLDQFPLPMHLVLASRADPPLPLARWRARDQLIELRAPDLRFSPDEAAAFLNERMGLNLTPEQVAVLDARAEGWIAGLQLAALSMQGRQDIAGFVNAFAGSNRFILDYLTQEVLQRQTQGTQTFLLQTSILDQMNASLADAVTGRNDSANVLLSVERANLFLVPLDDARQWYRYHHLFADLLQSRLQESSPSQAPELHRKASLWYEQNGFVNEAVDHALAVPDFDRAAQLIEKAGLALLARSEDATVVNWVAALPTDVVHTHPALGVWYATALAGTGKLELAEAVLSQVQDAQLDPQARGIAAMMRAVAGFIRADVPNAIESAHNALASAQASMANLSDPETEFNALMILFFAAILAEAQIAAGKLRDAAITCQHGFELGRSMTVGSLRSFADSYAHVKLADLKYEWNEIDAAAQHAVQGLELSRAERNEEFESFALVALAQVRQAQGDSVAALELVQQAVRVGRKRRIAAEMRFLAVRQVNILIKQDQLNDAAQLVRELPDEEGSGIWFFDRGLASIARARVLIAQREFIRAAQLLETARQDAETGGQIGTLIGILALLALALHGQGDTAQATATLTRSLLLAEPEGYIRTFVDLGEEMSKLLQRMKAEGGRIKEYAVQILSVFGSEINLHPLSFVLQPLEEPLSERELGVLRLIAEGLSNREIAERLVVTVSTVKTHTYNLYGKLGVNSRTQALAKARDLKLL